SRAAGGPCAIFPTSIDQLLNAFTLFRSNASSKFPENLTTPFWIVSRPMIVEVGQAQAIDDSVLFEQDGLFVGPIEKLGEIVFVGDLDRRVDGNHRVVLLHFPGSSIPPDHERTAPKWEGSEHRCG